MVLDWSDVRAKAAAFATRHQFTRSENAEKQTFWNEFFEHIFGIDRMKVAAYEERVRNLPHDKRGFIDLIMPGKLIIEHKSAGGDLMAASKQALDYWEAQPEGDKPRYILLCDFQRWRLLDMTKGGEGLFFVLPDLKRHITNFAFIAGAEVRQFKNQKAANPKATKLLTDLHAQLESDGYQGHKLQLLLVRLLFCLFADDTLIWPKDQMLVDLQRHTRADGSDLGAFLTTLFETLNTPDGSNGTVNERQAGLPDHFKAYPYINGRLFAEAIGTAHFDNATRTALIDASLFDWGGVSPAIFGALFEGVIDKVTRRRQGAHYTPEPAIFRLIGPLFLESLHDEFDALKARRDGGRDKALRGFHDKLGTLTFFDPACGAGNFLVVAYRELRDLERLVIEEIYPPGSRLPFGVEEVSKVNVDQFHGIEIDEFPSQIAQVALWMADHIANVNLGDAYGKAFARVPLVTAPSIKHADALEIDWRTLLPPERCSFVFGNPPFVGAKMQSDAQRAQVRRIAKLGGSGGTLDYVAAWFLKAADYVRGGDARIAFVATNSITQGEQVAQLWPRLFERGMEIAFGHQTFVWPGRAAVHCVIVGLAQRGDEPATKRLFSYPDPRKEPVETGVDWLTAYLLNAAGANRHLVVREEYRPINQARRLTSGSQPIDDGNLIFDSSERAALLQSEPDIDPYLRPYMGTEEYLGAASRWILVLQDAPIAMLRRSATLRKRLRAVTDFRLNSKRAATLAIANTPTAYNVTVLPKEPFLAVPEVSSEKRLYVPIGWLEPPIIPSNKLRLLPNASLYEFGVLTSRMHMSWLTIIGGRLESRFQYGIGIVYNTFPWPELSASQRGKVDALAQAVLDARANSKNAISTLADLYDADFMPAELLRAHKALDAAVDKLYAPKGFADDRARVEHLFRRYEAIVQPTRAAAAANTRTKRRVKREAEATETPVE